MSRKHKHRKHKGCCNGGNQHQCGGNCQCHPGVERVEITTEKEMWALINFITENGKKRENRIEQNEKRLSDALLADVVKDVPTNTEAPVALLTEGEKVV